MCLGANEPGGPRRCESYMRTVHAKMVELQQNIDMQRARAEQIDSAQKRIVQIEEMDKSKLNDRDLKAYNQLADTLRKQMGEYQQNLEELRAAEPSLRKSATTALTNHNAEIERRQRMGAVVDERGQSPIDENSPYITVSPQHLKHIESVIAEKAAAGYPADYKVRTRMVPVQLGDNSYHPFLTVEEVDVQFDDPQVAAYFGDSDTSDDMGHKDTNAWRAPTDKVLQAAHIVSDGGRNYVSQKNADDPEYSTGGLVRGAVFSVNNGSLVDQPDPEIADLRAFAKNYPGDSAYSQKIRTIASQDYIAPSDVPVLASAISGWRQYKDRKSTTSMRAEPRQQSTQQQAQVRQETTRQRASMQAASAPRRTQPGNFVGTPGEPIQETTMKVKAVRKFSGDYGPTTMIIAQDSNNNTFKWNASGDLDTQSGDVISLRGLVKEHTEYNGIKQTVITRGKMDVLARQG